MDPTEIDTWIFDLDNTLYSASADMHARVDELLRDFVAEFLGVDHKQARVIQKDYFRQHGLTLRGLMIHHGLDPRAYVEYMTRPELYRDMQPDHALAGAIARLPGRKIIYTNAFANHATEVLGRIGMEDHFEAIHDIAAADYLPKPADEAYEALCRQYGVDATRAVMVDDIAKNLEPAAQLGMSTVWMKTNAEWARDIPQAEYIDHVTDDLVAWIEGLLGSY